MTQTYYTADHEWLQIEDDVATIGITDHAQAALGEIVYVDLPEAGQAFAKAEVLAVVESVKAASDVYSPLSGKVVEFNGALEDAPELINESPEAYGWFVKLKLNEPLDTSAYMQHTAYLASLEAE